MLQIKILRCLLVVMCFVLEANSWLDSGHMLVARIAQIRLNKLNESIGNKFNNLVTSINRLCDERSHTLVESACWPDDIKQKQYSMTIWNSWHFTDIPYPKETTQQPIINITESVINSLSIMDSIQTVLKTNLQQNTAERALLARYLIHIVGDIHQPLHSATLYNKSFPNSDYGGNRIKIKRLNGDYVNFHVFWDAAGYKLHNQSWHLNRPLNQANYSTLNQTAYSFINQYHNQIQSLAENIKPMAWALQSYKIALNTTYKYIINNNQADQNYTQLTYQTSKKRITLAGYRLANFVIDIYSNPIQNQKINYWNELIKEINNQNKYLDQL